LSKKTFVPALTPRSLKYTINKKSSHLWYLSVEIPGSLACHVKNHITNLYRQYTIMPGMSCANLPVSYTQHYFAQEIEKETEQFLLNHFVEEDAQSYLEENKINIINWPRLAAIEGNATKGYTFTLALSLAPQLALNSWKSQTFTSPKRKNYTDLDIQVESFMSSFSGEDKPNDQISSPGDWVRFSAHFRPTRDATIVHSPSQYWLRLADASLTTPALRNFFSCKTGSTFSIPAQALSSLQPHVDMGDYSFDIHIEQVVKTNSLTIAQVRNSLSVTDHETLHNKLIEIFSFRNDISLRKAIVEELFYALFNTFRFEVAPHAITRRKELLHFLVQQNPDSSVYTKQKHFPEHMTLLAETKLKEEALIDAIAREEGITVDPLDISHYLSLASNEKLKEFLYFSPLTDDVLSANQPCGEYVLAQTVRREKTLNHLIRQLSH